MCDICSDIGFIIQRINGTDQATGECKCRKEKLNKLAIEKTGIKFEDKKFSNYYRKYAELEQMYSVSLEYAKNPKGWLYLGGQVGSGKTHLCTAICRYNAQRYKIAYMVWVGDSERLKNKITTSEYAKDIEQYKNAEMLYIDDLFKTKKGTAPTAGDIRLAFEILNYRYNDFNKFTMISSEKTIDDLMEIDEGIGSRIYEKSKESCCVILPNEKLNYRMGS